MVLVEGASRDEGYSGLGRHDLETGRQRQIFATVCTDEICQNHGTMTYNSSPYAGGTRTSGFTTNANATNSLLNCVRPHDTTLIPHRIQPFSSSSGSLGHFCVLQSFNALPQLYRMA